MNNKDFLSENDLLFNNEQSQIVAYATAHAEAWHIYPAALTALQELKTDWEAKFQTANDPTTRTQVAVAAKKAARLAYEPALRQFIKANITYNNAVADADRTAMGLPIHSTTRTPAPAPTTYPEATIDTTIIRQLTIHFRDNGAEHKAKPAGVHGAEIKWSILAAAPAGTDDLLNSSFDTKTPFTLTFTEAQRGQRVYFALRWENTRGEKGPWGEIESAVIP